MHSQTLYTLIQLKIADDEFEASAREWEAYRHLADNRVREALEAQAAAMLQ